MQPVIQWFELGGELKVPANASSSEVLAQLKKIQGLFDNLSVLEVIQEDDAAIVTSAAEFILEGLWAHKRINRSEERGYFADARKTPEPRDPREPSGRMPRRQFN
jgi:magnesium chelatase subunit I